MPVVPTVTADIRFKRAQMFNLVNILKSNTNLQKQLTIPDELMGHYDTLLFDYENKAQFIQDVVSGLEDYDIPVDIPVDEWVESLIKAYSNASLDYDDDSCDS